MAIGKKLIDAIKNKKKKKTGTPKFAPGKGGGSDAARKGKGTVGKKKPAGPKTPSRKMYTPEQMNELQRIRREQMKKGIKGKPVIMGLKRGGRAR